MAANEDLEIEFEVDDSSKAVLSIQNRGIPNRDKVTADQIGNTSFSAKLSHVQYGTYEGTPAALLIFNFHFGFRNGSWKRITYASIKLTFEETSGPSLTFPEPRNPNNDPIIAALSPIQVCGEVTTVQKSRRWNLTVPVQYQSFGITAGPQIGLDDQTDYSNDHRMWLTGLSTSEDDHDADNSVSWEIQENSAQGSGILHNFPAAVVITLPKDPEHHVKITGVVRPFVAFTVNPLRLKQKKDAPVYLDRKTSKGKPIVPGVDFNDKAFPWNEIVQIPTEYQVCGSVHLRI
jgi:hypothetical protein